MKKLIAIILLFAFILTLSGCGGSGDTSDPGGGSQMLGELVQGEKYKATIFVSREISMAIVAPNIYYRTSNSPYWTTHGSKFSIEKDPIISWAEKEAFVSFEDGQTRREVPAEENHVYFVSLTEILRKVSFEELGIQPIPQDVMREAGWKMNFCREISRKTKEYMEKHAEEIYGGETEKTEHEGEIP